VDDRPATADRWQRSPDRVGRGRCRVARPATATYPSPGGRRTTGPGGCRSSTRSAARDYTSLRATHRESRNSFSVRHSAIGIIFRFSVVATGHCAANA
jgi:hypothetical protein